MNLIPVSSLETTLITSMTTREVNQTLLMTMPDDTMAGELELGVTIYVDTNHSKKLEDGIFAFNWDGYVMVKQLQFMNGCIRVVPNNHRYYSWEITKEDFHKLTIIGRVVASQTIKAH